MKMAIIAAVALVVLLLLPIPDGVGRLASLALSAIFGYASYLGFRRHRHVVAYPFLALLVIYQPLFPFAVGPWMLVVIDVAVVCCLLLLLLLPWVGKWFPRPTVLMLESVRLTLF